MKHKTIYLLAIFMVACASQKKIELNSITKETHPKLLFLNYIISKNETGKSIKFINKIIADGKLKANNNKYIEEGMIGDLKCSQLNSDSIEINHVYIKNPLSKTIEYVNDSLIFENKQIDLNNAALSLKLQLENAAKFITISEIIDTLQHTKPLITTRLN